MKNLLLLRSLVALRSAACAHFPTGAAARTHTPALQLLHLQRRTMADSAKLSDAEWKAQLTPVQYEILRLKGTERAGTGEYNKHYEAGTYVCAGCKTPLYTSDTKFDSGCGWPAFFDAIPGAIKVRLDASC